MVEAIKIDGTERIARVLRKYDYNGLNTSLSYINRLFPHLGEKASVILLCHIQLDISTEGFKDATRCEEESAVLDVTGSPLSHSFGDDSFNVTLNLAKRNWLKEEEKYRPIPRQSAIMVLNLLHEEVRCDKNWDIPLFALCNAVNSNCILLGSHFDQSFFITYRVIIPPMQSLMSIQDGIKELLTQHLRESSASEDDIDVNITSTYELCGTSNEMIDWREQPKNEFRGYLKIEASWNDLCFLPPPRGLCNYILVEIMSGSRVSPLHDLWNQIILLNKYLSILEEYRKKDLCSRYSVMPLNFPKHFSTPYQQDENVVTSKLNFLLGGGDTFDLDNETSRITVHDPNLYEIKLIDLVKELTKRENLDFTDRFWQIVRGTENYMQMTDCVHTVIESMSESNFKPQLNDMGETRFAKMVLDLESENGKVLQAGSSSLELVIDMGLEKIRRDYVYLLSSMNIMEALDLRKKLSHVSTGEFQIEQYRNKLTNLAQIHISLEFVQLIQSELQGRCGITYTIFECASKKYCANDSPLKHENLMSNTIYTLNMPAPREFMTAVTRMPPSSWMCTLSTAQAAQKLTTVNHFSRSPIFPPNIYKPETLGKNHEEDEMYHVTTALITYLKRPNLMK